MKLALVLKKIADVSERTEATSNKLLAVVRAGKLTSIRTWRAAVKDAYAANGWHTDRGKPKADSSGSPVPRTVRTYVSDVSAAFRFHLDVVKFATFYELRQAVVSKRREHAPTEKLKIKVTELTGEPFNDVAFLGKKLKGDQHEAFLKELSRVVMKFRGSVTGEELPKLRRVA